MNDRLNKTDMEIQQTERQFVFVLVVPFVLIYVYPFLSGDEILTEKKQLTSETKDFIFVFANIYIVMYD
jgi:hypothetical protein